MTIKLLKKLIKETVTQLDEDDDSDVVDNIPTTFNAFRKMVVASMKACGASKEMTHEIEDLDYAAGQVVALLHEAWSNISTGMRSSRNKREEWENGVDYSVRNVMLNVASKHKHKKSDDFAYEVVEHMLSTKRLPTLNIGHCMR